MTMLDDVLLGPGNVELLQAFGTDHTASGDIINGVVGENVVFGDMLYRKSDSKWWKSDANAEATMLVEGMAIATIAADATGEILVKGFARDSTWTWTVAAKLFASATAGALTETQPAVAGDIVQKVATAYTATIIKFDPGQTWVEIA